MQRKVATATSGFEVEAGAGGSSAGCPPPVCMRLAEPLNWGSADASTAVIVVEPVITAL